MSEVNTKQTEAERLREQIVSLDAQREFTELDCESAASRLDAVRTQVNLDKDTLSLIEDDSFLKHKSISKALDEMEKKIQSVEKRIALIIKFRTKYNNAVESAIFTGNGEVLNTDELFRAEETGDDNDGIRETAPPTNQRAD